MVEYFVHVDPNHPPGDLVVVRAEIPADVSRVSLTPKQLPENWRQTPAPSGLAVIGDEFVLSGRAAVLIVPSVVAPTESNWLINPRHSGFANIRVHPAEAFQYDSRFFG
jgi:RES domain-containing protein